MLLRSEHTYAADPDTVFEMLADPGFRARVSEAQDVVSHDIVITSEGAGFTLVNDQVQRTEGLPAIARKFTGDTTRAIQKETWPDRRGASLGIEAPGKPSEIKGTVTLTGTDGATREVVEIDLRVKVPLIGHKLEALLGDTITRSLDTEFAVGDAWLAGER